MDSDTLCLLRRNKKWFSTPEGPVDHFMSWRTAEPSLSGETILTLPATIGSKTSECILIIFPIQWMKW